MKFFNVRKEILSAPTKQFEVYIDGTQSGGDWEDEKREITTGFIVDEWDEDDFAPSNTRFYPVKTDTEYYTNNEDKVLEKIINDHQPGDWQNHNW